MSRLGFSAKSHFGRFKAVAAAGLMSLVLGGCETFNPFAMFEDRGPKTDIGVEQPAAVLYNDGLGRLEKGEYQAAAKKFVELDRQYPYSDWTKKALIMQAHSYYSGGEYDDAIGSGRRFVAMFPNDKDTAYAQYLVGMSYYRQIPDVTRDQERTEKALIAFDDVYRRWPQSEYASDARQRALVARDNLAGKEMQVGRYYLKQRNYTGAVNRFREVIVRYQTTRHVEEALMRVAECYMALGIVAEAQTATAVLGHNFPDSPWYKDAYTLVQSGGAAPREDQGSWISRAFRGFSRS